MLVFFCLLFEAVFCSFIRGFVGCLVDWLLDLVIVLVDRFDFGWLRLLDWSLSLLNSLVLFLVIGASDSFFYILVVKFLLVRFS